MHLAGFCCDASQLLMLVMCVVVEVVLTLLMLLILPVVHIVPAVPMVATLLMLVAYVLSTVPMFLPDAAAQPVPRRPAMLKATDRLTLAPS